MATPTSPGPGARRLAWPAVVVLGFVGWVWLYADRMILPPVLKTIGAEWALHEGQLGLISSVFFFAYTAVQIPTGVLADRFGTKGLLVWAFVLFGLATGFSGLAPHYSSFLLLSAVAGVGQGMYYPALFALSSKTIPPARRASSTAVINSGQAVGISFGLLLAGFTTFRLGWGWRVPFVLMAVPTVGIGLVFAKYIPGPVGSSPAAAPASSRSAPREPLVGSVLSKPLLGAYFVNFASLYGFFMILTWLPYYLQVARGFPETLSGIVASVVPWASVPGALAVSRLSDRSRQRQRMLALLLPVAALAIFGVAYAKSHGGVIICLVFYGLVGKLALDPVLMAYVTDWAPRARLGTAMGLLNFCGMAASVLAPYITGYIAAVAGRMDAAFYLAAAILMVGFAVSLRLQDRDINRSSRWRRGTATAS